MGPLSDIKSGEPVTTFGDSRVDSTPRESRQERGEDTRVRRTVSTDEDATWKSSRGKQLRRIKSADDSRHTRRQSCQIS